MYFLLMQSTMVPGNPIEQWPLVWTLKVEIITDVENRLMVTRGKGGGTNWETGIGIYISIYKIDT